MKSVYFQNTLRLIAVIQCTLGIGYLLFPSAMLAAMDQSPAAADLHWPLGMLAARFIGYGAGLWLISRDPLPHLLWIRLMGGIQLLDLLVEVNLVMAGSLTLGQVGIAMFNAVWIGLFCLLASPRTTAASPSAPTPPATKPAQSL